jgi:tetratricopeptide (TPR) repeat protein
LTRELNDRSGEGRACGNLGNVHYLLGDFDEAIAYHEKRLEIAKEFGDKNAQRRAYTNLGNAHVFSGNFETAADQYKYVERGTIEFLISSITGVTYMLLLQ